MKFKPHFYLECIFMIPLGIFLLYLFRTIVIIPMIGMGIYVGTGLSDSDLKLDKSTHRNIWFHSIIVMTCFLLVSLEFPMYALSVAILNFGVGVHLLGDIKLNPSKRMGFYTICYGKYYSLTKSKWITKRMNGKQSTYWLLSNWLVSVAVLVLVAGWLMR